MSKPKQSAYDLATKALEPLIPRLLAAFASVRGTKPPQSARALQPLAFVFLLEAFGLAFLLTDETRRLAWQAARPPGRGSSEEYDPTDDADETKALQWAAARVAAIDSAYREHARALYNKSNIRARWSFADYLRSNYAPDRAEFERQWGERNPIDPATATATACFDPRAQLSLFDAVSPDRDGAAGVFVAEIALRAAAKPVVSLAGHTLDASDCSTLHDLAWRAISSGWVAYLDHRSAVVGLRLLPPTDAVRTRLRAPLINLLALDVAPPSAFEAMAEVSARATEAAKALGDMLDEPSNEVPQPEPSLEPSSALQLHAADVEPARDPLAFRTASHAELRTLVWPDESRAPDAAVLDDARAKIKAGEAVSITFDGPKGWENARAWLTKLGHGTTAPEPVNHLVARCAIAAGGEAPPIWSRLTDEQRDAYPGRADVRPHETVVSFKARVKPEVEARAEATLEKKKARRGSKAKASS
jgi:hypothetical protein